MLKKIRKISSKQPNFKPKLTRERTNKSQISRRNEIIKIRAETIERENKNRKDQGS